MQPLNQIWDDILAWENLLLAYRKARRGKRQQAEIQDFGFNLEYELADIRQSLIHPTYQPGGFWQFHVRDRKLRLISAAPFRDRVVQHALMNRVEPAIDKLFIANSYASRKHKGVHAAVRQYRIWANRYAYALKIDIRRYFDSVDHLILKQKLAVLIAEPDVLWLFNTIIDSSPPPLKSVCGARRK
jgi:RNA-directed DNA polymerase